MLKLVESDKRLSDVDYIVYHGNESWDKIDIEFGLSKITFRYSFFSCCIKACYSTPTCGEEMMKPAIGD